MPWFRNGVLTGTIQQHLDLDIHKLKTYLSVLPLLPQYSPIIQLTTFIIITINIHLVQDIKSMFGHDLFFYANTYYH